MNNYPLTSKYDPDWIHENWMGPNPLWLLEELCQHLDLKPGMRVLDMGCGKGLTSVFLAKEYGVTVFANDLWIPATENFHRFEAASVADRVFPIQAEAHALPYAEGFFDAAIAIDSYHYFGTSENYLTDVFAKLVNPDGQLGIVVPGYVQEYNKGYPDTMAPYWEPELLTFHAAPWWRHHWAKTATVEVRACYNIPNPKEIWHPWAIWAKEHLAFNDIDMLEGDTDNQLALIAMAARKR